MTEETCRANSLVGTRTKDYIYGSGSNISKIGITYAPVLPVPFLALAIIFVPARAKGIVSSYTGEGLSYPFAANPCINSFFKSYSSNSCPLVFVTSVV